jgi:iron complex outermembrane receptor protein
MRAFLSRFVIAWALALPCLAADFNESRNFDIKPQPMDLALIEFSKQAGFQVIADSADVGKAQARAINGMRPIRAALEELLKGSGLSYRVVEPNVIVVGTTDKRSGVPGGAPNANPMQLAQAQAPSAGASDAERAREREKGKVDKAESIVITGSRLPAIASEGPLEVRSYDRRAIEASGAPNIARFLNTLPEVSIISPGNPFVTGSGHTVQLRGFPVGSTLTLLDGRRLANSGISGTAFDLNNLPVSLVERIDILPLGSSAIYGSDAIAGVVNIVLKKGFDGLAADASYATADKYANWSVSASAGRHWERGWASVAASFDRNDAILGADREFMHNNDFSRFASLGGIDARSTVCSPGTVLAVSGNLPGLNASTAAIPPNIVGRPSVSDFAATAGQRTLCNPSDGISIVPAVDRSSFLANGTWDVTNSVTVFGRFLFSRLTNGASNGTTGLGTQTVPATNAFNPFGVAVRVSTALAIDDPKASTNKVDFMAPVAGVRIELPHAWSAEVTSQMSQDKSHVLIGNNIPTSVLQAALASSNPATALNLFSVNQPATREFLDTLFITTDAADQSRSTSIEGVVRGPVVEIGGHDLDLAIGGMYERQKFVNSIISFAGVTSNQVAITTNGERTVKAFFAEARLPLFARAGGDSLLTATAAWRRDDYSDFGTASTPQLGLELRPLKSLLLRASYAEAFKAPQLVQLYRARVALNVGINDPQFNNQQFIVPTTTGGNLDLQPEKGKSKAIGLVWDGVRGLAVAATYWHLDEDNRIISPTIPAIVNNPDAFPGRVVRDASNHLVSLDLSAVNYGALHASGYDVDAKYRFDTSAGRFEPSVSLTYFTKYTAAITPGSPLVNRLGFATQSDAWSPRLKGTARLGWSLAPFTVGVAARYTGQYLDYQPVVNNNHPGGFTLWDLSARVDLARVLGHRWLREPYISLAISNVADRKPDYSNFNNRVTGYDPFQNDVIGRLVTLQVGARW